MNKFAKQYLKKVNKRIHCPGSMKSSFMYQLGNEVLCFCDDHEYADMALLEETFGFPDEVAEAFFSELGDLAVNRCSLARQKLLYLSLGIVLTAVIFMTIIGKQTDSLKQKLLNEEFTASVTYEKESGWDILERLSRYMIFGGDGKATVKPEE